MAKWSRHGNKKAQKILARRLWPSREIWHSFSRARWSYQYYHEGSFNASLAASWMGCIACSVTRVVATQRDGQICLPPIAIFYSYTADPLTTPTRPPAADGGDGGGGRSANPPVGQKSSSTQSAQPFGSNAEDAAESAAAVGSVELGPRVPAPAGFHEGASAADDANAAAPLPGAGAATEACKVACAGVCRGNGWMAREQARQRSPVSPNAGARGAGSADPRHETTRRRICVPRSARRRGRRRRCCPLVTRRCDGTAARALRRRAA